MNFIGKILKTHKQNFVIIHPLVAELFHGDGKTEMKNLILGSCDRAS